MTGNLAPGPLLPPANKKFEHTRKNRWFIFCHGYSVGEQAARGWNAEVFKRLHQMGSDARFLAVTWNGNQSQIAGWIPFAGGATPDYWQNVYNAFLTSSALAATVNGLPGNSDTKVIAGHSLGNMLVSSAICDRDLAAQQYFMLDAAVPRGAYYADHVNTDRYLVRKPSWNQYDGDTRLWPSDYWKLFPDADGEHDGRNDLKWSGRFSSLGSKTAPHNYYSSGEEVLKKGDSTEPNLFFDVTIHSELAWVKQEMGKGTIVKRLATGASSADGGWAKNGHWNAGPPANTALLKADPFFKPFSPFYDENGQNPLFVHGALGSAIAAQYPVRAFLLAHEVPAISNPAGSDRVDLGGDLDTQNKDMMEFRTGTWGTNGKDNWKHCDLLERDFGYVWKLYSDMVSRGSLHPANLIPPTE